MPYRIAQFIVIPLLKKISDNVCGINNLPKPPFIIASNHITQIDALPIIANVFSVHKKKVYYIMRQTRTDNPLTRIAVAWAGCIVVDNQNKSRVIEDAVNILNKGNIVGIFPEGARNSRKNSQNLLKGKTGVARIAHRTGFPVVPISIKASPEPHRIDDLGNEFSYFPDALFSLFFEKNRISLNIGKPISFEKIPKNELDYKTITETTEKIMKSIGSLCGKTYPY